MVKAIIENTHIISSKITKFIWFLGYCIFSKMNMYFETEGEKYPHIGILKNTHIVF